MHDRKFMYFENESVFLSLCFRPYEGGSRFTRTRNHLLYSYFSFRFLNSVSQGSVSKPICNESLGVFCFFFFLTFKRALGGDMHLCKFPGLVVQVFLILFPLRISFLWFQVYEVTVPTFHLSQTPGIISCAV